MAVGKLKGHTSPGTDQIPAELNKAGGTTFPIASAVEGVYQCTYL